MHTLEWVDSWPTQMLTPKQDVSCLHWHLELHCTISIYRRPQLSSCSFSCKSGATKHSSWRIYTAGCTSFYAYIRFLEYEQGYGLFFLNVTPVLNHLGPKEPLLFVFVKAKVWQPSLFFFSYYYVHGIQFGSYSPPINEVACMQWCFTR